MPRNLITDGESVEMFKKKQVRRGGKEAAYAESVKLSPVSVPSKGPPYMYLN